MDRLRNRIFPGLRGALFYAAFWGAIGIYEPFLNVYFLRQGIDAAHIGWLAVVLPLCVVALVPLVTRLADRTHRRVITLALACLGFSAAVALPAIVSLWPGFKINFVFLVGFVILCGVFRSPIIALADSLVASMSVRHALDFGSMRLWGSFVFTLTATCLGLVWARTGFNTMFLAAGITFLPVAFGALLLEEAPPILPDTPSPAQPKGRIVLDRGVLCLLGATFLVLEGLFMSNNFAPIYITQLSGNESLAGAVIGIAALGEVPGMLFGRRLARRLGETNSLLLAYVLNAAGLAGYALTRTPAVMLIFSALRGLGFGMLLVNTVMIINTRAPLGLNSTYQGLLNAAGWGLAPLLGGPASGWVFQNLGPPTLFFIASGMTLAAGILIAPTYWLWRRPPDTG